MGIDVTLTPAEESELIDVLAQLDLGSSSATDRAGRAKEAKEAEKAREKARASLLKRELKQEVKDATAAAAAAAARPASASAKPTPSSSTVRVTLCSIERPSERKTVVLKRAPDVDELLKTAKTKLKLKKGFDHARLLDGGAAVTETATLDDGVVVAVSTQPAAEAEPEAAPAEADAAALGDAAPAAIDELRDAHRRRAGVLLGPAADAAAEQERLVAAAPPAAMAAARAALPMAGARAEILETLRRSTSLVLQGETGCGKSTQLPQFLLEEMVADGRGGACAVVVTQPRRVSAMALAQRVAEERGEALGETVGYAVRGASKRSAKTRILFVTTGVLLSALGAGVDATLGALSHVILDEVHERSLLCDFCLTLLRDSISAAGAAAPRLVLMSATLQAAQFSEYLGGAPVVKVPGRLFDVQDLHLEDALEATGYSLSGRPSTGARFATAAAQPGRPPKVLQSLRCWDDAQIDYGLLHAVVRHLVLSGGGDGGGEGDGAVLVFLTGVREIERLASMLEGDAALRDKATVRPLHGALDISAQRKAFERAPAGRRKVVVATNVAETSVTIPDVVFVVDAGKVRQSSFVASRKVQLLQEEWISKEAAAQRRGRAGRVRAGVCYQLWPKGYELAAATVPEMCRAPLEEVVLHAILLGIATPAAFLARAPSAPPAAAVAAALDGLSQLQACDSAADGGSTLTPLGVHLAHLPVDARLGKMLVLATLFDGCVAPMLTVCAFLASGRPLFSAPRAQQKDLSAAQRAAYGSTRSDALAAAAAYDGAERARADGGAKAERTYCDRHFVSTRALHELRETRRDLERSLRSAGFDVGGGGGGGGGGGDAPFAEVGPLLRSIICAALYPSVARATRQRSKKAGGGAYEKLTLDGAQTDQVWAHPSSLLSDTADPADGFYAFGERTEGAEGRPFVRDLTSVSALGLLVFGAKPHELSVEKVKQSGRVELPAGFGVRCAPTVAMLLKLLRRELDRVLTARVARPAAPLDDRAKAVCDLLAGLLARGH